MTWRGERRTLPELSDELFLDVGDSVTKRWRFAILLALAAVIATAGVLSDSTATVIGAMIVAPLGTPIIGTALGIVTGNVNRVASSAITVVLGATAVVAIGWALAAILPELIPLSNNSQISGRTSPSLIDLVARSPPDSSGPTAWPERTSPMSCPGLPLPSPWSHPSPWLGSLPRPEMRTVPLGRSNSSPPT